MRVLLAGYYGFGNVGDEAILSAIVQQLRVLPEPPDIQVLSATPDKTAAAYSVAAADRWRLASVRAALRRCDLLIHGGGGLIQDATSWLSPTYYLGLLWLARALRRPYVIFAHGLGPLRSRLWQSLTARAFDRARAVVLRDEASAELLRSWGFRRDITVAADPALLLKPASHDELEDWLSAIGIQLPQTFAAVVPRAVEKSPAAPISRLARRMVQRWPLVVMPFQANDEELSRQLAASVGPAAQAVPVPPDPRLAAAVIARAEAVATMRFHGLVFAAAARRPALALAHDPKLKTFAEAVGYPVVPCGPLADDLLSAVDIAVPAGPDPAAVEEQIARAHRGFSVLSQVLQTLAG